MGPPAGDITALLSAVHNGDPGAAERLWRVVHDELRRIAHARMAAENHRTDIQTTVLVQEAYLRLLGRQGADAPANRRYFFAAAANAMRQFLVDDARKRGRLKRGGDRKRVELGDLVATLSTDPDELLALDEALARLRAHDARKAQIVELRYFAGLTVAETAETLGISVRQVSEDWRFARAWLHREMS